MTINPGQQTNSSERLLNLFTDEKQIESLTIKELIDWRQAEVGSKLLLPPIQRSVVWKNEQVINYWDSLLRGYPAGMMMVHRVQRDNGGAGSVGRNKDGNTSEANRDDFQLFDGQQRMSAVLLGFGKGQMSDGRKLWIDLTPSKNSGLCFQLRISSMGQPFGYRVDLPNQKIELGRRQDKWEEWRKQYPENATPQQAFSEVKGSDLISSQCAVPFAEICIRVCNETPDVIIEELSILGSIDRNTAKEFVTALKEALKSTVVLQLVAPEIVKNEEEYIRFFGRLGQGGTPLSDDELTYSIIKQQYPEVHDRMQDIKKEVGRIISEVDLVLAALRVSTTLNPWDKAQEHEIIGRPSPTSVSGLRDREAVKKKFFEMIPLDTKKGALEIALKGIRDVLTFNASTNQSGLPSMLLARLPREIIDVLVLFAVKRGAENRWGEDDRATLCSFVLYWLLFVGNDSKAAWYAYQHGRDKEWHFCQEAISKLIDEYEKEGIARFIPRQKMLQKILNEVTNKGDSHTLRPWSARFTECDKEDIEHNPGNALRVLSTNSESIKRALMWIQRKYITENYPNYDPTSDRDDDLPIDLDHIVPHDIFQFNWGYSDTRLNVDAISENFRWNRDVVGNSLGNYRWLDASKNRKRGNGKYEPLKNNADFVLNHDDWNEIIPQDTIKQNWSKENIATFQRLIDLRTLELYKIILTQSGIEKILPPEIVM